MRKRVQYSTDTERAKAIEENIEMQLIGEELLLEGAFLVFETPSQTELEIRELRQQNTEIMLALAELSVSLAGGMTNG